MRAAALPAAAVRPPLVDRLDPRCRVVAAFAVALAFAAATRLPTVLPMALLTLALIAASGLGPAVLWRRLRWPGLFVGLLVALLPFTAGETVTARLGPVALYGEGLAAAVLIAGRFVCIVASAAALFASLPLHVVVRALRALAVPWLLTDLALLVVRYLEEVRQDLARMRLAMQLRGHGAGRRRWSTLGAHAGLLASLLLRSYERADRVYLAMRARGYGAVAEARHGFRAGPIDRIVMPALACLLLALVAVDRAW